MNGVRRLSLAGALLAAAAVGLYLWLPAGTGGGRGDGSAPPAAAAPPSVAAPPPPLAAVGPRSDARAPLTAQQVAAIDPERDPQSWVEAVDGFRARMERFARGPPGGAQRREEGEELLLLVDAFAGKGFYLPGQASQAKLEIARQIYGGDPELMAKLTGEYEAERLAQLRQWEDQRQREQLDDPRFQTYKAQEAALVDRMTRAMAPGPERDAAIAQAAADLHRRIFGGPEGP